MKDLLIYKGPFGHIATLTTESPASRYGNPVLRVVDPDGADWLDYGPLDVLPSGLTAAELVVMATSDGAWRCDDLVLCQRFTRNWPEGPQVEV